MLKSIMTRMKLKLAKALYLWSQTATRDNQRASDSGSSPKKTKKRPSGNRKQGRSKRWQIKHSKKPRRYSATLSSSATKSCLLEKKGLVKRGKNIATKKFVFFFKWVRYWNRFFDTDPFKVISKTRKYKYNLPTKMVNYANEQFHSYLKNADIKEKVLFASPVPENLNKIKKTWRTCEGYYKRRT